MTNVIREIMNDINEAPEVDGLLLFACHLKGWDISVASVIEGDTVTPESVITIKKLVSECDKSLSIKDDKGTIRIVIDENETEMI